MSKLTYSWIVPVASMLCALTLGWAAGPSMTLLFRAPAEMTGNVCHIKGISIFPIRLTVHVDDFITDIQPGPNSDVLSNTNKNVILGSGDFEVFGPNPKAGKDIRVVAGKATPDDNSQHDVVLVKIEGTSKPEGQETLYVESVDVDDPSAGDPTSAADSGGIVKGTAGLKLNSIKDAINYYLRGQKGSDSAGRIDNTPPGPAIDWENLNADNRGENGGGQWMKFDQLEKYAPGDAKALSDPVIAKAAGRPILEEKSLAVFAPLNCNKHYTVPTDKSRAKTIEGVQCKRIRVDKVTVNSSGEWTAWLLFKTSLQPGDNFRIMATCGFEGGLTPLDHTIPLQSDPENKGRLRVKRMDKKPFTPDPNTGRTDPGALRNEDIIHDDPKDLFPALAISEMITVWRRLHLELDWMSGIPDTVEPHHPNGRVKLLKPDIALFKKEYEPAYVEVEADVPEPHNKYNVFDLVPHMPKGTLTDKANYAFLVSLKRQDLSPRNVSRTDPYYWSNHLCAFYEASEGVNSNEPLGPSLDFVFGGVSALIGDGKKNLGEGANVVSSEVFHETCRWSSTFVGNTTFTTAPASLPIDPKFQNIIQRAYLHESGHQFCDGSLSHNDGGIMFPYVVWIGTAQADPKGQGASFVPRSVAIIRSNESP